MRSKEVDLAINQLKEDVNIIIYGNQMFEDRTTCKKEDLKTILAYIGELEEKCKSEFKRGVNVRFAEQLKGAKEITIPAQYIDKQVIRDKIKELEAMAISQDIYYEDVLKIFKDLLEGE